MTAHDVVARLRRILAIKQVGHGGTLDPLATGVLPVATGKACRLIRFLPGRKVYVAEILLGMQTTTDDIEGEVLSSGARLPAEEEITRRLAEAAGVQMQVPPAYSAVSVRGERLYDLARKGRLPDEIPARQITVYQVEVLDLTLPVVRTRITCSPGTYIRSLARDLGKRLSCGGCLKSLVREQSGPFYLQDALTLEELSERLSSGTLDEVLLPPQNVLDMASAALDKEEAARLILGQRIERPATGDYVLAVYGDLPVAVCRTISGGRLQPEVVIADGKQID